MARSEQYTGAALPAASTPAWTRTTSGTINNESVTSGVLRVGMASSGYLYYSRTDSTTGYDYARCTASMKLGSISPDPSTGALLDGPSFDIRAAGKFLAGMAVAGSTKVRCAVYNGTSWSETEYTVASTTDAFHEYEVIYNAGTITWTFDGTVLRTYSGTMYTAGADNIVRFGDTQSYATVTDGYFDSLDYRYEIQEPRGSAHQVFNQLIRGEVDEDDFEDLSTSPGTSSRRNGYFAGGSTGLDAGKLKVTSSSTTANLTTRRQVHTATNVSTPNVQIGPNGVFNVELEPNDADAAFAGIIGFADSAGTSGYGLRVGLGASATSEVVEINTGTPTVRASTGTGVASGTAKRVKLIKEGATISAVINGTLIAEWTDSADLVNPAFPWFGARSAAGSAADYRYDNYYLCLTNDVHVRGLTSGQAARAYNSAGTVVASAVAGANGVATLDLTLQHFPHIGYIQCFTDNTYTTTLSSGRFPASGTIWIGGDDEFEYDLASADYDVITHNGHAQYATGQYGSGGSSILNGTMEYGIYLGHESTVWVYELDTTTGLSTIFQVGECDDHHDIFSIQADSDGYLHVAYGGGSGYDSGEYKKSTNAWDISAWSTATDLDRDMGILLCDTSDNLLHYFAQRSTGTGAGQDVSIVHRSKTSGGAWSAGTVLITNAADWRVWIGDAVLGREASGRKSAHLAVHAIKRDGSAYQVLGYIKTTDGGTNFKDLAGNTLTLPLTQDNTTGQFSTASVHVKTGAAYLARLGIDASGNIHLATHEAGTGGLTSGADIQHWIGVPGASWTLTTTWSNDQIIGSFCLVSGILAYITSPVLGRNIVKRIWNGSTWGSTTWLANTPTDGVFQDYYSGLSIWVKTAEDTGGTARATWHTRHVSYSDGGKYTTGFVPTYRGSSSLLSMDIQVLTEINLGAASETDTAQSLTTSKTATLGTASETDQAQSLSTSKELALGLATETDEAQAITSSKHVDLGLLSETDAAQSLTANKAIELGVTSETDAALSVTVTTSGYAWLTGGERALMRSVASATFGGTAVIQTRTLTDNGQGGRSATWAASGTVACNLAPVKRRGDSEQVTGGRALTQEYRVLTLPAATSINETDRAVISGKTYEVTRVDAPRSYEITRRVRAVEID